MTSEAERKRLVELCESVVLSCKSSLCADCEHNIIDYPHCMGEHFANYLLDNGIIVPPCKVGDIVYVIEPCNCYNNYSEFDKCHHRRTKATKWIEMVRVPTKHYTKCLKLFERPFKVEYFNKIGKTVFLTREEAEKALKKGENNG